MAAIYNLKKIKTSSFIVLNFIKIHPSHEKTLVWR